MGKKKAPQRRPERLGLPVHEHVQPDLDGIPEGPSDEEGEGATAGAGTGGDAEPPAEEELKLLKPSELTEDFPADFDFLGLAVAADGVNPEFVASSEDTSTGLDTNTINLHDQGSDDSDSDNDDSSVDSDGKGKGDKLLDVTDADTVDDTVDETFEADEDEQDVTESAAAANPEEENAPADAVPEEDLQNPFPEPPLRPQNADALPADRPLPRRFAARAGSLQKPLPESVWEAAQGGDVHDPVPKWLGLSDAQPETQKEDASPAGDIHDPVPKSLGLSDAPPDAQEEDAAPAGVRHDPLDPLPDVVREALGKNDALPLTRWDAALAAGLDRHDDALPRIQEEAEDEAGEEEEKTEVTAEPQGQDEGVSYTTENAPTPPAEPFDLESTFVQFHVMTGKPFELPLVALQRSFPKLYHPLKSHFLNEVGRSEPPEWIAVLRSGIGETSRVTLRLDLTFFKRILEYGQNTPLPLLIDKEYYDREETSPKKNKGYGSSSGYLPQFGSGSTYGTRTSNAGDSKEDDEDGRYKSHASGLWGCAIFVGNTALADDIFMRTRLVWDEPIDPYMFLSQQYNPPDPYAYIGARYKMDVHAIFPVLQVYANSPVMFDDDVLDPTARGYAWLKGQGKDEHSSNIAPWKDGESIRFVTSGRSICINEPCYGLFLVEEPTLLELVKNATQWVQLRLTLFNRDTSLVADVGTPSCREWGKSAVKFIGYEIINRFPSSKCYICNYEVKFLHIHSRRLPDGRLEELLHIATTAKLAVCLREGGTFEKLVENAVDPSKPVELTNEERRTGDWCRSLPVTLKDCESTMEAFIGSSNESVECNEANLRRALLDLRWSESVQGTNHASKTHSEMVYQW